MGQPETQAVLVPPPPGPPSGRVAAATPDPPRDPSGAAHLSFPIAVLMELRRFVWPAASNVWGATTVTIGLLAFFALYIYGLNAAAGVLSSLIGFR